MQYCGIAAGATWATWATLPARRCAVRLTVRWLSPLCSVTQNPGLLRCVDPNVFRGFVKAPNRCPLGDLPLARLYTPDMDALFQRHYAVLEAVFRRLKTKPYLTPAVNSRLELPQWLDFLKELKLIHPRLLDKQVRPR
jgi:hypothetical protein